MIDQHPKHNVNSTFERISNQNKLLKLQQTSERAVQETTAAVRKGDIHREDPIMDSSIQLLDVLLAQTGPNAPIHSPEEEANDLAEITKYATEFYTNVGIAVLEERLAESHPLAQVAAELRGAINPDEQNPTDQS